MVENNTVWESKTNLEDYLREVVRFVSERHDDEGNFTEYRFRNVWNMNGLFEVSQYIEKRFKHIGDVEKQSIRASFGRSLKRRQKRKVHNVLTEIKGTDSPEEIIIIGAHYDSRVAMIQGQRGRIPLRGDKTSQKRGNTPGANDNGSGIAALLALGAAFAGKEFQRTIRFAAWVNEEYPFYADQFRGGGEEDGEQYCAEGMGSLHHASSCADKTSGRENIVGAISLDTMGCYPGTHYRYPSSWLEKIMYLLVGGIPTKGDYVGFLSNGFSKKLTKEFQKFYDIQCEIRSINRHIPCGLNWLANIKGAWSDDWSFWKKGYPGFIVTDMAYLRSPHYHCPTDILENINFPEFTQVVWRLRETIEAFANKEFSL